MEEGLFSERGAPPEVARPERGRVIVLSGMQGAGKSTVAAALAKRFDRAAHVSADVLQRLIVSGGEWPSAESIDEHGVVHGEAAHQLRLRLRNACVLARSFADAGIDAIIDDIIIGQRVDELLDGMAGETFAFVMLTPRLDVVRQREAGRGTSLHEAWGWMHDEIRQRTRRIGLWLDTSTKTAEQTADEIMRRRED
jgi:chloramphenicol 3-O-phosphotransferase